MRGKLGTIIVFLGVVALSCASVSAHHGSGISYDLSKRITLKGTVTEFAWSNPHAQIYFDIKDANGALVHWGAEMNSPGVLSKAGWTVHTLKPGDEITLTLAPSKSGAPVGLCGNVVLPNGKTLVGDGVVAARPDGNANLNGTE
jgi:hypothetical protein